MRYDPGVDFMEWCKARRSALFALKDMCAAIEGDQGADLEHAWTQWLHSLGCLQLAQHAGLAEAEQTGCMLLPLYLRAGAFGQEVLALVHAAAQRNFGAEGPVLALAACPLIESEAQAPAPATPAGFEAWAYAAAQAVLSGAAPEEPEQDPALARLRTVFHLHRGSLHDRRDLAQWAKALGLLDANGRLGIFRLEEHAARALCGRAEPANPAGPASVSLGVERRTGRILFALGRGVPAPSFVRVMSEGLMRRYEKDSWTVEHADELPEGFYGLDTWKWRWDGKKPVPAGQESWRDFQSAFGQAFAGPAYAAGLFALLRLGSADASDLRARAAFAALQSLWNIGEKELSECCKSALYQAQAALCNGAAAPAADGARLFWQALNGPGAELEAFAAETGGAPRDAAQAVLERYMASSDSAFSFLEQSARAQGSL